MAPPAAPPLLETTLDDVDRKRHKKQPFDPKYVSFCLSRMGNPDGQPGGGTSSGQPMRSKLQGVDTAASELHARMEVRDLMMRRNLRLAA